MDLVVDANVLFSVLIKSGKTEDLMFELDLNLFAPEFIFQEFEKYKDVILIKSERSEIEFNRLMLILKKKIKTVSNKETEKFISQSQEICPDENDVDYFALALKLKCDIWSNDKKLKDQSVIRIYSTSEL